MKSFAASNAYVSAVHELIPGGANTYAKGDNQYPADMAPVICPAGPGAGSPKSTSDSSASCHSTSGAFVTLPEVIVCRSRAAWLSRSVNCSISRPTSRSLTGWQ